MLALVMMSSLLCLSCGDPKQTSGIYPTAPRGTEPDGISFSTTSDPETNKLWGDGEDADLPALFESVCVEDQRQCGGTHIDLDGHFILVDFQRFESLTRAQEELKTQAKKAGKILRTGSIKDQTGQIVGQKLVIKSTKDSGEMGFSLLWTRGARFAQIRSESIEGIERYESDRGL